MPPLLAGGLALLAGLGLVGAGLAALPPVAPAAVLGQGATLYAAHCAGCHGAWLEGGVGPALDATGHAWRHSQAALAWRIARGGRGMPSFGETLDATEIAALLAHLGSQWPAGLRAAQAALPAAEAAALLARLADPAASLPAECDERVID